MTLFFKPLGFGGQTKVTNADITTKFNETACSENLCSNDLTEASQVSTSESIEAEQNCSNSVPESSQRSNTPEIPPKIVLTLEPEVQL